ncbi:MAG: EAL and HDOD domain-containing protein [Pseudomonadota bacterium]
MPPDTPFPPYLVRQPLVDAEFRAVGHAFRLSPGTPLEVLPGAQGATQARDEHLIASVIDLEFVRVLGDRLTVLDLAEASLDNPMLSALPAGKVAVPVPASRSDVPERLSALRDLGLTPLLDDDGRGWPIHITPPAEMARIDSARHDARTLGDQARLLRRQGVRRLVAGNVDTEESFEVCRQLAFDIFQGEFLTQPRPGKARAPSAGLVQVMELLNQAAARAPFEVIEAGFKRNAALTYRLLRYINSPANGLSQPIQSIGHALVWLGHEPLYRWLTLLLFSARDTDGRDAALLGNALVRARFMENLGAARLPQAQRGGLFIVGVLSHLDALLDQPMAEALTPLHLPEAMSAALLTGEGPYAPYLKLAKATERFDQAGVAALAEAADITADAVNLAHVDALIWSDSLEK